MDLEKQIKKKFDNIEKRIFSSFSLIREDIKDLEEKVEKMREYMKKQKRQFEYAKKEDEKLRKKFKKKVEEQEQKTNEVSLILSRLKGLEKDLITKKDLAKMEESIRNDLKRV